MEVARLTIGDISSKVRELYSDAPLFDRMLLYGRPYICPFHLLAERVPVGATVLDIGCGNGLFLNLIACLRASKQGIGFDASSKAITLARQGAKRIEDPASIDFRHIPVEGEWTTDQFDVVSMIDVLHHIAPRAQEQVIADAAARVKLGGMFLFKDIGTRPLWRAWANRLHDLVLSRQWIHYVPAQRVVAWAEKAGLALEHQERHNMLWYGHELLLFRQLGQGSKDAVN